MNDGFIKIAAATPDVVVANPRENYKKICESLDEAYKEGAKIIVFPELCLTGYTCNDLFYQEELLESSMEVLLELKRYSADMDSLIFIGMPLEVECKIYNVAAVLQSGEILAFVPKTHLPNYNEFYEIRQFTPANKDNAFIPVDQQMLPFGTNIIFETEAPKGLRVACEIC
jgi:NAD+ synthase (glutamine-hydrolysing)